MLFPLSYALDNSKDCTVASKLQGDLAHSFRRPVRGGVEADQLDNIMEMVQSKPKMDQTVPISPFRFLLFILASFVVGGTYAVSPCGSLIRVVGVVIKSNRWAPSVKGPTSLLDFCKLTSYRVRHSLVEPQQSIQDMLHPKDYEEPMNEIIEIALSLSSCSLGLALGRYLFCRLVHSCCVIFDLEPLSLSFDLVFYLLIISPDNLFLDNLDIFKEDLEYQICGTCGNEYGAAGMMSLLCRQYLHLNVSDKQQIWTNHVFFIRRCRVSSCNSLFSLPERLKADNMIRVNQLVTTLRIESSIHLLDQNRYPFDTSLIHIESCKSPTVVLFDDDIRRISIRHCEILKSITLNVLAKSQG
ncbi:hypothetical protein Tco_0869380 [Tanacetum coccineum]